MIYIPLSGQVTIVLVAVLVLAGLFALWTAEECEAEDF